MQKNQRDMKFKSKDGVVFPREDRFLERIFLTKRFIDGKYVFVNIL